jgi:uncharacterized protein with HEPN domain
MYPSQLEFLRHILDECHYILKVTEGKSQEEIINDETLSKALIRSLEIVGEATKRTDENIKIKYPFVNWKEMAGMRDRLIHDYFGVDYDIVYNTIVNDIPQLHEELQRIIHIENKKQD